MDACVNLGPTSTRRGPIGVNFAVRDLRTGKERLIATGHKSVLSDLVFSPDGRWLASGNYDGTVKLWEVGAWRCVATLSGMGDQVRDVAFSPDSQRLVTGSNPVKLWDLTTFNELASLAVDGTVGHGKVVAFSPDGNILAVRDRTAGTLYFWRANVRFVLPRTEMAVDGRQRLRTLRLGHDKACRP